MANFNFNKVILGGRISSDLELKTTPSGVSVCTFGLAVTRRFGGRDDDKQTDFFNIVAWRQTAEFINNYFSKGSSICIVGQLQTRSYTDKEGKVRYVTEVTADEAVFVDSKAEADNNRFGNGDGIGNANNIPSAPKYIPEGYAKTELPSENIREPEDVFDDDSLPF